MASCNPCERVRKVQTDFLRSGGLDLRTRECAKVDENANRRGVEDRQVQLRCIDSEVPRKRLNGVAR